MFGGQSIQDFDRAMAEGVRRSFKKEFEDVFRGIALQGYAVLFISHDKEKVITRQNGTEYTKIVPTVSDSINNIVKRLTWKHI